MAEKPKSKYGPTRGEHIFRICAGVFILCGIGIGLWIHGFSGGPMMLETVGVGGSFAVLTIGWSVWKLRGGS